MKKPLTVLSIRARVDAIGKIDGDPEKAHAEEDKLYLEVLTAIAGGDATLSKANMQAFAIEALRTQQFKFPRLTS